MSQGINKIERLVARHNRIAKAVRYYCFGSTAPRLRDQALRILQKGRKRLDLESLEFAANQMEKEANAATTMATMLRSTECLLLTWKAFLTADFHEAWDKLIEAQNATRAVLSYSSSIGEMGEMEENPLKHLLQLERLLFPWQAFFSPSLIIEEERCSICEQLLDECPHLPGKLYMGQPCRGKVVKFSAIGASLVKEPADKRCYARNFPARAGRTRDNFTGILWSNVEERTLYSPILRVSTYMRDFAVTQELLNRSFGGYFANGGTVDEDAETPANQNDDE